jgi:colicin import membrane protein
VATVLLTAYFPQDQLGFLLGLPLLGRRVPQLHLVADPRGRRGMSKPGVVLRRPAGSSGRFAEHSDLPSDLGSGETTTRRETPRSKPSKRAPLKISDKTARKAAADFEKEQKRREAERRREEAARERDRERREKATAKAQAALDKAEREHANKAADIRAEVEALEKRSRAEYDRWEKERERLQAALRRARE